MQTPSTMARDTSGRALDMVIAFVGLILLLPVFAVIIVVLVASTGFPVFYRQTRVGRGGRRFEMLKFRKFTTCSGDGCPLTLRADARMTTVGAILERTKLDELPQLFNILRGEMSVVGPRPESLAFADCFDVRTRGVLDQRPGLFGPAQVAFRNECMLYPEGEDPVRFYREVLFPAKAALDMAYYPGRTFLSDLGWIVRGILAVTGLTRRRSAARILNCRAQRMARMPGAVE